ncbi:MAG: hypothetical protein RIR87_1403 [Actinomycetota bacterium]
MFDPSLNSTIECTTDCGCTTASIFEYGISNKKCASIISSPLFTKVAELIVTTGPIDQVGWANASATFTRERSSRVFPRNGPPLAVSWSEATSRFASSLERKHWCSAQCSLSTGTIIAPFVLRNGCTIGPAAIKLSLLASAKRLPCRSVSSVTGSPAKPTTAFTTTSAPSTTSATWSVNFTVGKSAANRLRTDASTTATTSGRCSASCSRNTASFDEAASAVIWYRPRDAATTSSVCRPMDPVLPARATLTVTSEESAGPRGQRDGEEVHRWQRQQYAIEAIQYSAMALQHGAEVLHSERALQD